MPTEGKKDEMQEPKKPARNADQELEEAVERVYQQYGPDLSGFVRDVQRDIQKRSASQCCEHKPLSV